MAGVDATGSCLRDSDCVVLVLGNAERRPKRLASCSHTFPGCREIGETAQLVLVERDDRKGSLQSTATHSELGAEGGGRVGGGLAGVVLAHVGVAVAARFPQRGVVALAPRQHDRGRHRSRTTSTRSGRSPAMATSVMPRACRATAARALANPLGDRGTSGASTPRMRSAWLAKRASPVSAASRSNARAAVELADGVALSKTSFWRTISRSPSSGVVNSPPWSTSQK